MYLRDMVFALIYISLILLAYWLWFAISHNKAVANHRHVNANQEGVSIIIAYKNEGNNISKLVNTLLHQNYPRYEIIAIDDFSADNGPTTLSTIDDPKLINLSASQDKPGKKFALSQAIAKAQYPYLLFTDGDCMPQSIEWISTMMAASCTETDLVCGYAPHTVNRGLLGLWQQFETWMTAMQFMTYAISGLPYMAVGRNMLVKKTAFEKVDGYGQHMNISSGDDDLLVQAIAAYGKVTPCIDPKSWMISPAKSTIYSYLYQKTRHVGTSVMYHWKHKILLSTFAGLQLLFWITVGTLLVFKPMMWRECIVIIVFKWLVQMICQHYWAKSLKAINLQRYFPFLDILTPIYYMVIGISSIMRRQNW